MKHWFDVKTAADAPLNYQGDEAGAWADGYNAAVQACSDEQTELIRRDGR